LGVMAGLVFTAAALSGALVMLEWRPPERTTVPIEGCAPTQTPPAELKILSWNIGYAGLDREADFFMDGGRGVHARSLERVRENLAAIVKVIQEQNADILLLQEVDRPSARTYRIDEVAYLVEKLPGYTWSFAPNFNTWVPVPLRKPMGRVYSGLLSASRYRFLSAERLQLPTLHPWPVRVFHLKRCLHRLELEAAGGKRWVIYNLHLSVFSSGEQRLRQLQYLAARLGEDAAAGALVVAGGDFNQAPGDWKNPNAAPEPEWFRRLPADWLPEGFSMAFDLHTPSLRATDRPYRPGVTFVTVLDGFVIGPAVELIEVKTLDLDFAHSDHHPVLLRVRLRQ